MRIIAGACRGKKLFAPPGMTTRPTSDRVKEALFSILYSRIDFDGITVLDVCAGTGSLGLEALSRGAGSCCFIENNQAVKGVLEKNLLLTCCTERSEILNMDAAKALNLIAARGVNYDLVFFDPPYDSGLYSPVFAALESSALLKSGAILVAECSARQPLFEAYGCLTRFARRVYGETALELFTLEEK